MNINDKRWKKILKTTIKKHPKKSLKNIFIKAKNILKKEKKYTLKKK